MPLKPGAMLRYYITDRHSAGGIAAEISREQYARQKDNKQWQVEFPPAALRVF